jgi:hypothetical protein
MDKFEKFIKSRPYWQIFLTLLLFASIMIGSMFVPWGVYAFAVIMVILISVGFSLLIYISLHS